MIDIKSANEIVSRFVSMLNQHPGSNQIVIHTGRGVPNEYKMGRVLLERILSKKMGRAITIIVEPPTVKYVEGTVEVRCAHGAVSIMQDMYL